jgi:hypothetical protein
MTAKVRMTDVLHGETVLPGLRTPLVEIVA